MTFETKTRAYISAPLYEQSSSVLACWLRLKIVFIDERSSLFRRDMKKGFYSNDCWSSFFIHSLSRQLFDYVCVDIYLEGTRAKPLR
jgi:hypothetical protein